jgi:hypothetical protein
MGSDMQERPSYGAEYAIAQEEFDCFNFWIQRYWNYAVRQPLSWMEVESCRVPSVSTYVSLYYICLYVRVPGSSVGIATELRAGRSGDRIPVGGEIFRTSPDRPWGPPSLLCSGYRVFPGDKVQPGHAADHSPLLVPVVMEE